MTSVHPNRTARRAVGLKRRTLITGAVGLGLFCDGAVRASDRPSEPRPGVHDLTPDFWRFYDADVATPDVMARARNLGRQVFAANADIYAAARLGAGDHGPTQDATVAEWLGRFDPLAPAVRSVSQMLPEAWQAHEQRFKAHFAAYRAKPPVYILMSLFQFDISGRSWRGRECVFVGVDGLVKLDGEQPDLATLLDREAFQIYQAQVNPDLQRAAKSPPLWLQVWRAGLATYTSATLNPKASPADVLMSADLAAASLDDRRAWAASLLPLLDTAGGPGAARFLTPGDPGDIPARSGYLLGAILAERAGRSLSLDQLARLPASTVHRFMHKELSQIVHG